MLVSVQVCAGVKVLCEWGIFAVNSDSTVGEVFHGLSTGQIESATGSAFQNSTPILQSAVA